MDLGVYASRLIDPANRFTQGHRGCVGCGEALAMRHAFKAIGRDAIVVNATGCMEIISSAFPATSWELPWIHTLFENTSAVASGVETAYRAMKRKGLYPKDQPVKVVALGGDGATADIGIQALSGAMERGHEFIYLCFDNEAYMNTGIQRSGETPYGATTTTMPAGSKSIGQVTWKKNMPAIAIAHNIPYVATASPAWPFDLTEKVKKAMKVKGPAYIHIYSPCPTGWRCGTETSIRYANLATQSCVFPLYEFENGKYHLNVDVENPIPVKNYLKGQGRFRHLSEENIKYIQERVMREWNELKKRCTD
jgi:pyruvate ferredoxin oxidoreductase beta subunit